MKESTISGLAEGGLDRQFPLTTTNWEPTMNGDFMTSIDDQQRAFMPSTEVLTTLHDMSVHYALKVLRHVRGNKARAAKITLYRLLDSKGMRGEIKYGQAK